MEWCTKRNELSHVCLLGVGVLGCGTVGYIFFGIRKQPQPYIRSKKKCPLLSTKLIKTHRQAKGYLPRRSSRSILFFTTVALWAVFWHLKGRMAIKVITMRSVSKKANWEQGQEVKVGQHDGWKIHHKWQVIRTAGGYPLTHWSAAVDKVVERTSTENDRPLMREEQRQGEPRTCHE